MKKIVLMFIMVTMGLLMYGAESGSHMGNAISLRSSQSVTLVDEYDPDFGDYYGIGVRYYKVSIKKGAACTIWITGGNAANMSLAVDTNWEDENAPFASFDYDSFAGGTIYAAFLDSDAWFDDDPSSGTFYVCVSGEIGDQAMLYYASGIQEFIREGEEGNPKRITVSETSTASTQQLMEGDYYFIANLQAGKRYSFRTTGGTDDSPMGFSIDPAEACEIEVIPAYAGNIANTNLYIYPKVTQDYIVHAWSKNDFAKQFKLKYYVFPSRLPGEHETRKLYESENYTAEIVPGRYDANTNYYDDVIDESLCRIKLPSDAEWVFESSGSSVSNKMVVYNADGSALRTNTTIGNGSFDCRIAIKTTYAGWYYVGICRPELRYWDAIPDQSEKVQVRVYNANEVDPPDEFDSADDSFEGGEKLIVVPAMTNSVVTDAAIPSSTHALNAADWQDYFVLPCRAGTTYALKAVFAGLETTDLTLAAKVYKIVNGERQSVSGVSGSISPEVGDGEKTVKPLTFTADQNGMYCVRVKVAEGDGLDFPDYQICAIAYKEDGTELGLVQVKTKGADAKWWITDDAGALYPNGAYIALPVGEKKNIRFSEVSGYSTPPKTPVYPREWNGNGEDATIVEGVYNDTSDPIDDEQGNASQFNITPENALKTLSRTLWKEDPVDWMRFKGMAGYYYNFSIEDTTNEGSGDAVFSIKYYIDETNIVENVTECRKLVLDPQAKGKFNLSVSHSADPAKDSSYKLHFQAINAGQIRFASLTPSVSESADYVDIAVQRTASEGEVRVNYATEKMTAIPGREYYPTNGVLAWAEGDMSEKYIRVRLIPDMVEKWERVDGAQLRFRVRLWPMADDVLAENEYPAQIENDTATIKIKDISQQETGSVKVIGPENGVVAGDKLKLKIVREGGSDGRIAVRVKTQPGTAVADIDYTHYDNIFVWNNGESNEQSFEIETKVTGSLTDKKFNVKLYVLNTGEYEGYDEAELPVIKFYYTLKSEITERNYAESVIEAETMGVGLESSGSVDWYTDKNGVYTSTEVPAGTTARTDFTVVGSGLLVLRPKILGSGVGNLRYKVGNKGTYVVCSGNGDKLILPIMGNKTEETTVVFKLNITDGMSKLAFEPLENGSAFKWINYSSVVQTSPIEKSVAGVSSITKLSWSQPDGLVDDEKLVYRVRISSVNSESSKIETVLTNSTYDTSCVMPSGYLKSDLQYWWVVDFAYDNSSADELEWTNGPNVFTFSTVSDEAPSTSPSEGYSDALGNPIVAGKTITLAQGVECLFFIGADKDELVSCSIIDGALPPGVTLYGTGKPEKIGRIRGVPTVPGEYPMLVQVVCKSGKAKTLLMDVEVKPLASAVGTYTALIKEDGAVLKDKSMRIGRISHLEISETGKIRANVKFNAGKYVFEGECLNGLDINNPDFCKATLEQKATDEAGNEYVNKLELSVYCGSKDSVYDLVKGKAGTVRLILNMPDADGLYDAVEYTGDLVRDNSDVAAWKSALSPFVGYYTMALVPEHVNPAQGVPCGNGYIAFTISENGVGTYSGKLADGTDVSGSSKVALRSPVEGDESLCNLILPIGIYGDKWSFGGKITVSNTNLVIDSTSKLEWNKEGVASSFDGEGFSISIAPTGGFYNSLVNLQTYYLNRDFSIEAQPVDGIPAEMLPDEFDYTAETMPHGVGAVLTRSSLTPDTRLLVSKEGSVLYDLAASVNPWKVKTSFVPETGLLSGTFRAWSDGKAEQKYTTLNHYGVLLMNRDEYTPMDKDVWTAGFYLLPVTDDWTFSLPFNIRSVTVDRDWFEAVVPEVE